jgi:uncharacterized protein (DUF983 family)
MNQWRIIVNAVMKLRVAQKTENLTTLVTSSFLRMTLLYGVSLFVSLYVLHLLVVIVCVIDMQEMKQTQLNCNSL